MRHEHGDQCGTAACTGQLSALREPIDAIDRQIVARLQDRARLVLEIGAFKREHGLEGRDPERENEILRGLADACSGPLEASHIREIYAAILRTSLGIQEAAADRSLRVKKRNRPGNGSVRVGSVVVGGGAPVMFVGPCSIESAEQMERIAPAVARLPGPKILRGGAFKPRTSPYAFQGLRQTGLDILHATGARHGLATVTEVLDVATLDSVAASADMLQVGARNMYNTELLKALGRLGKPVLLKRGFMATLEELMLAAEYILAEGNEAIVLCERGIRTFERATRNTLDISAVPLLKNETGLPVIVDLSHALGRRDILLPCARAALAAGADGLMVEVHDQPEQALSDGFQQIDLAALEQLAIGLGLGGHAAVMTAGAP
jgi:3-deoxy-7-phosphoheptulonate synthase/chorismate mutase